MVCVSILLNYKKYCGEFLNRMSRTDADGYSYIKKGLPSLVIFHPHSVEKKGNKNKNKKQPPRKVSGFKFH